MGRTNLLLIFAAWMSRLLPAGFKRALYRLKPLAQFIRQGLNLAAPPGVTQVKVAAGALAGTPLLLDLRSEKDIWLGVYEPELLAAIGDWVKPGMVAYDVGANIGYISLLLAKQVGAEGQVFAFEALPENLERLQANLEMNGLLTQAQVVPVAVVEATREVRFLIGPSASMGKAEGSAGRQEVDYPASVTVAGVSLDDFVFREGNPAPQVVKMDIEGGEVLALPGMRRVLVEKRPLVLLEIHGSKAAEVAWDTLVGCGYRICRMCSGYPEIPALEALAWKAYVVALPLEGVAWRKN